MDRPAEPSTADVRMRGFARRTPVHAVHRLLEDRLDRLESQDVPVAGAAFRVLAQAITAPLDVPGFDRSAMDGYAVIATETFGACSSNPLAFRLMGQSLPGRPYAGGLRPGQAVRIMTGAAMPAGATAVAVAEVCREENETVWISAPFPPGKNIGRRGEDVAAGRRVLEAGRRLRPQDAALAASLGLSSLLVVRRPAVDLLATGDELLPPGSTPAGDRIIDSNSVMLAALVSRDGGSPAPVLRLPDKAAAIRKALMTCRGDLVLISGGSSVGTEDHAPLVLREIGELPVHGVGVRPASPTGIGFLPHPEGNSARPVFLLPGNPVSCLCAYDLFAARALAILSGRPARLPYRSLTRPLARKVFLYGETTGSS
ncbi:MAG: molybdopterin molybdotransferase MoeA, partial [Acidobacteriota bacterium]